MSYRAGDLHHVAIVVPSIAEALPFWRDVLGFRAGQVSSLPDQRVRVAFLSAKDRSSEIRGDRQDRAGQSPEDLGWAPLVELVEPLDQDSGVARFLAERRKATFHHVCFAVDDLPATLDRLAAAGVELVDREPRQGAEGDIAFLHPRSAGGVMVELIDRATIREDP